MIILRQKYYSKPDSEKSVNLGGKRTKFKDMSEKQLKNLASYERDKEEMKSTEKGRKEIRKRNLMGGTSFTGIGLGAGILSEYKKAAKNKEVFTNNSAAKGATKKLIKSAGIGALAGLGTWELLKLAAKKNHKKNASLAKKELERRGITDLGPIKSLDERNKEVLEDLKRK